jgi:orotidine-5'-phosphate decarboxylase
MNQPAEAASPALNARDRIIVALDVDTEGEAREVINELRGSIRAFKVGLQLFTAAGPAFVREVVSSGVKVFLDLKFHDIPNTVAKASVEAARAGVWMFNLHCLGGSQMMRQAVNETREACERESLDRPLIIGVTVLTSSTDETLIETGINTPVNERVAQLARLSSDCGLDGVVASPREVREVRNAVTNTRFLAITPGIRSKPATGDDQQRVTTLREAIANGSDYVVIGRPILDSKDRSAAVQQIVEDVTV